MNSYGCYKVKRQKSLAGTSTRDYNLVMNKSFYTYYQDYLGNIKKFKFTVKKVFHLYVFSMSGSTDVFNHNHIQDCLNSHTTRYGARPVAASDKIKTLIQEGRL